MSNKKYSVKLSSTAFCKAVLIEPGTAEHSLIGIMPAIQIAIELPKGPKPERLPIPLMPGLSVFAMFERTPPLDKSFEADIEVQFSGPFPKVPSATSKLTFPPGIRFSQMPIKFGNPHLEVQTNKDIQETEIKVVWAFEGTILGEAILPIVLKITEKPDANNLSS